MVLALCKLTEWCVCYVFARFHQSYVVVELTEHLQHLDTAIHLIVYMHSNCYAPTHMRIITVPRVYDMVSEVN